MQAHWLTDFHNEAEEENQLQPFFYMGSIRDEAESIKEGRDIFKDVPFVRLRTPNDRTIEFDQPAIISEDEFAPNPRAHNLRFPKHWARFLAHQSQDGVVGTPLKELPMFSRSIVDTYAASSIKTLETLANLSDEAAMRLPQGLPNRAKARGLIAQATGGAAVMQIRSELDAKSEENADLKKLLREQSERLDRLEKSDKKQPKSAPTP